jgi:hypothetical protein
MSSDSTVIISGGIDTSNYTITLGNDTIDLSGLTNVSTVNSIDIGTLDSYIFNTTVPFEDGFPEWHDFEEMRKEYPGLEKTFEHLKVFYKMCKDDWEAKKRGDND